MRANADACARARRARGSFLSKNNSSTHLADDGERTWTDPVPGRLLQRSVGACERAAWSMLTWPADGGAEEGETTARPFLCKSYRCRRCGPFVARRDLARITAGALSRPWWLYAVLTVDPRDFDSSWDAYKRVGLLWDKRLRKRFERAFGKLTYVQTWERHLGGAKFPHVNLLLTSDGLRESVEKAGIERRFDERSGHGAGRWSLFPRWRPWLAEAAPASGFGMRVWCEVVHDAEGMAWYLTKAAHDVGAARFKAGDQTPIGAPPGFRRFRASRGLLPPREHGDGLWTGAVSARPLASLVDRETGELDVDAADIQLALDARARAAAWAAVHPKPAPRYEVATAPAQA